MDSRALLAQMRQLYLWPQGETAQRTLTDLSQIHAADVRAFARELLQHDLLTAYQANLLLTDKGQQLIVGPYVILERLGEGGMGQVFKARHRAIQRPVALKVIRRDRVTNDIALTRFFREVRAAAKLDDPNIVRAYDADVADGTYYFAMEYVRGTDLSIYIKSRGPLPIEQACQLLSQAALGLQHIHEHGMVHRDIKPGNLMLALEESRAAADTAGTTVRAAPAVLKILDLGLARLGEDELSSERDTKLGITHEGTVMGTVDYMSPEQARNSREADIRSDIYSLGCTFYFALTGKVPFPGGTPVEKMLRHQSEEPASLDDFRPHVPPLLAEILKKMMAKEPAARYQTPAEVAAALMPLVAAENAPPPLAIPLSVSDQPTISDLAAGVTQEEGPVPVSPYQAVELNPQGGTAALWAVMLAACFVALILLFAVLLLILMK